MLGLVVYTVVTVFKADVIVNKKDSRARTMVENLHLQKNWTNSMFGGANTHF